MWGSSMRSVLCLLLVLLSYGPALPAGTQGEDKHKLNPTPDPTSKYEVYVPLNLEDSFAELKKMLHPELLKEMRAASDREMVMYHMGLGRWMRNNWGLWGG